MWKETFTVGALAIALAAMPAIAQQTPGAQQESPAASDTPLAQDQARPGVTGTPPAADQGAQSADLKGLPVYSSDGQKLGEVVEVRMNSTGGVDAIHVDIGSYLGLGSKTVAVESGDFKQAEDRIDLSLTAEEAKALPEAS